MASHTPGPWKADAAGIKASMVSTTLSSGRRVCFRVATCKDGDIEQVKANARLIAAAPDLLEALKAAQELAASGWAPASPSDPRWAQIAAAIAKATA